MTLGQDNRHSATPATRQLAGLLLRRLTDQSPALPEMYPKQREFVMSEAHHVAFVGGIGSGKSYGGCVRALMAGLGWVGGVKLRTPNLGAITAPTYPMLRDATLRTFLEVADAQIARFNRSEMLVTLHNGSEIIFRSTEHPERLRGPSLSWWYADEAAMYPATVRKIMLGRLRQFGQRGYEWLTTTPRGRNYIWQVFVRDMPGRADYALFQATSRDNIYLAHDLLEDWESEYEGDFARQELLGEFVAYEGLIYSDFDRERHVYGGDHPASQRVIAGVDWGFANPGVILVCGVDGDGRMSIMAEAYERRRRVEEWVEVAKQLRDQWGVSAFYCDPSGPDNIKLFQQAGLKAEPANNTVMTGINYVKNRLAMQLDGRVRLRVHRECGHLIDEFEQYQWAQNRHGVKDEPVKANDHALDALRYAVMAVDNVNKANVTVRTVSYA